MTLIAEIKERENIAEYILYMWQMEDLIRGNNFNIDDIMHVVFPDAQQDEAVKEKYRQWFLNMIGEMNENGLRQNGHIKKVKDYLTSLDELHLALLITYQDKTYMDLYKAVHPQIGELREKSGSKELTDIYVCLTGLYGYLVLKMSKKGISRDTEEAMKHITKLLAHLSGAFRKMQNGQLGLPRQLNN